MKLGHEPTLNLGLHVALFHAICCYSCMRESRGGGGQGGECLPPPCNIQVSLNYIIKLPKNMPGPPLPPANSNNHRTPPFPPGEKYNCVRKLNWIEKTNQLKKVTVNCWTISKIINLRHYIYIPAVNIWSVGYLLNNFSYMFCLFIYSLVCFVEVAFL